MGKYTSASRLVAFLVATASVLPLARCGKEYAPPIDAKYNPASLELEQKSQGSKEISQIHISGQLQDNETSLGQQGEARIYNPNSSKLLENLITKPNGDFEFNIKGDISDLILQARLLKDGNPISYIRTTKIPARDTSNLVIKTFSYDDLIKEGIKPEDFVEFIRQSYGSINIRVPEQNVEGVEILDANPLNGAYFTKEQQDILEKKILDPDIIGIYVNGRTLKVQKDNITNLFSGRHYGIDKNKNFITTDDKWRLVVPNSFINSTRNFAVGEGFNNGILIRSDQIIENKSGLFAHEMEHMLLFIGHTKILSEYSLMGDPHITKLDKPGLADKKIAKIVNNYSGEIFANVVGMDWLDETQTSSNKLVLNK